MKTIQRLAVSTVAAALMLGMIGCSGMSTRDKYTVGGAGVGAVGGALFTDGSTLGTVGGAALAEPICPRNPRSLCAYS